MDINYKIDSVKYIDLLKQKYIYVLFVLLFIYFFSYELVYQIVGYIVPLSYVIKTNSIISANTNTNEKQLTNMINSNVMYYKYFLLLAQLDIFCIFFIDFGVFKIIIALMFLFAVNFDEDIFQKFYSNVIWHEKYAFSIIVDNINRIDIQNIFKNISNSCNNKCSKNI
jgi:hypothetical protein